MSRTPQLYRETVSNAQLLLDFAEGMLPFAGDHVWLARLARRVLGERRVEQLHFHTNPLRGVAQASPPTFSAYRPPRQGTPIVVFTDFGQSRPAFTGQSSVPAAEAEWLAFINLVERADCRFVAITPFTDGEFRSARLRRVLRVLPLTRKTNVLTAHNSLRDTSHRGGRS